MKRKWPTYHTLHFLKAAEPKLCNAIIANCNQETLKSFCECALNVLRGNITLSACSKRKLRTYINSFCKVRGQEHIPLRHAESYNSAWRSLSPAAPCYITHSQGTFIPLKLTMLQKMYLVSSKLFRKLTPTNKQPSKIKRILPQIDCDKWI